uniref:ATPase H+ transporting accessory protein 1 like n=1 Tax=Oryzias latipes TaxID=8090 RepID=A0A3P9M3F7_ORYLA
MDLMLKNRIRQPTITDEKSSKIPLRAKQLYLGKWMACWMIGWMHAFPPTSSGQWWFSVDSVLLIYNSSEEALFNASDVYAPASSSYRCPHVSSLQRYSGLLLPSTDYARRWSITFIDFQIQAFNVSSGRFSPASDCTTILTPAILMGLISSLILLLVLAYALHMVIHLKHIEHDDNHKADMYFPQSTEQLEHCCDENTTEKNAI